MDSKYEVVNCTSVDEFLNVLRLSNARFWGDNLSDVWLFRGHADEEWPLTPKLWRNDVIKGLALQNKALYDGELANVKKLVKERYDVDLEPNRETEAVKLIFSSGVEFLLVASFAGIAEQLGFVNYQFWRRHALELNEVRFNAKFHDRDKEFFLMLALAQHYGVPTRLLDWTYTPTAAVSFATFSEVESSCCCVWAISAKELTSYHDKNADFSKPLVVTSDRRNNANLDAQDGVFTAIFDPDKFYLREYRFPSIIDFAGALKLKKIRFPWSKADRRALQKLLIRERRAPAHLMPSLENCAKFSMDILPFRAEEASARKRKK